jgi:hypothetical protein
MINPFYINEINTRMNSNEVNEESIEQYLIKDINAINEKNANDLKKTISTYVESVLVFEDKWIYVNILDTKS